MTKNQQEQAKKLLKASFEILQKCDSSTEVLDVMSLTTVWDGAERDGSCLKDEIEDLLFELLEH